MLGGGVVGWRGGGRGGGDVRAYESYAEGEAPPEPFPAEAPDPDPIDQSEAEAELMYKNVLV